jgi:Ca-activated chloride channel family protein
MLPAFAGLMAVAALASPAAAGKYAAMEEVPASGGELRLAAPINVQTASGESAELIQFPLESMKVHVEVSGPMAEYSVEQRFENSLTQPIEAVYVFPLGDDAAVSSYAIQIGERTIEGEIKKRDEARQIYDQAKSSGHTAGLLEQEKANIFTQRVANIPPGEAVTVKFRYVEMLDYEDGRYELIFPMVVGPRYLPANGGRRPVGSHRAGETGGAGSIPYHPSYQGPKVQLTARIDAGAPVAGIRSPSHAISTKTVDDTGVRVALDGSSGVANRDFILRYQPAGKQTTVGLLTHRNGADGFFMLSVMPKQSYKTGDIAPREVIFLIDHSGSMHGESIEAARALSKAMIDTLSPRDTFNVIAFANGTKQLEGRPIAGDDAGKARGKAWLDAVVAEGGTEMERGILASLAREPGGDRIRIVYVITDGYVGNDDVILSAAQKKLAHNRIYPVGVGSSPNRYLLDRLGEVGRGFTRYIGTAGDTAEVATELVRKSAYPYMTNLAIDWGGLPVKDVTPSRLPDVYAGMPLVVGGLYARPASGTVKLSATVGGRRVTIPLEVELPKQNRQRPVAYLWARRRIHELMALDFGEIDERTERRVTSLGLSFGLVTEFTSYVAVDRTRVVNSSGQVKTLVQPAATPEGVDHSAAVGSGGASQPVAMNNGGAGYSAPPASSSSSSSSRSSDRPSYSGGGGGGGGDMDPLTLLMALLLIPGAILLRRRQRAA